MPLDWMDVSDVSFNALLLFERVQLSWFPGWRFPEPSMSLALEANASVAWYLRHKCPEIGAWLDGELARAAASRAGRVLSPGEVRAAEVEALASLVDLLVYALDPAIYDRLSFLDWDSRALTGLADFRGRRVLDIGSGTGRLAFAVTGLAQVVWAVEPVGNLREFLKEKARRLNAGNFYAVDGTITSIPFPDGFAEITLGGHVFGDDPEGEYAELARVTCPGGKIILFPGNNDVDNPIHAFLVERGFQWSAFVEGPADGEPPANRVRIYWKTV